MVALSVLDQSPIRRGGTAEQAVRESVQLAQAVDRLGYTRYWLAEHHSSGGLACAARFSWRRNAEETLRLLEEVAGSEK